MLALYLNAYNSPPNFSPKCGKDDVRMEAARERKYPKCALTFWKGIPKGAIVKA
jgi:hypothetical protein